MFSTEEEAPPGEEEESPPVEEEEAPPVEDEESSPVEEESPAEEEPGTGEDEEESSRILMSQDAKSITDKAVTTDKMTANNLFNLVFIVFYLCFYFFIFTEYEA